MIKHIIGLLFIITSCGSPVEKKTVTPIAPSISTILQEKIDEITPHLLTCDGGPTDAKGHNITGRNQCDTGDSILPLGLLSTVDNKAEYKQYIYESISLEGRPYRSPEHTRVCEREENRNNPNCNFSRDHTIGHVLYAISTKDCTPLQQIYEYSQRHDGQICEGSVSQCSLTLPIYDLIGDAYATCGLARPFKTKVNDTVVAYTELLTVMTNDEFQLELAVNYVYTKYLAGTLMSNGIQVVEKALEKKPTNLYFQYVLNLITKNDTQVNERVTKDLISLMNMFLTEGSSQTVWIWQWEQEYYNANGWSYIFLAKLLLK